MKSVPVFLLLSTAAFSQAFDCYPVFTLSGTGGAITMKCGAGGVGPAGPQGIQGIAGVPGANGPQGIQGVPGDPGPVGAQGIQGVQGIQGIQGVPGPQGLPGSGGSGTSPWVYAEAFGAVGDGVHDDTAAINAALDSVGGTTVVPGSAGTVALLNGKTYLTSSALLINKSFVNLICAGLGMMQCVVKSTSTTDDIVRFNGMGAGNCDTGSIYWSGIKGLWLTRATAATAGAGVSVQKGCWVKIEDIESEESFNNFYISSSANTLINRAQASWRTNQAGTRNGLFIDSSSGGFANASTRIKHFVVDAAHGNNGILLQGQCIADTFIDDFEIAHGDVGININALSARFSHCDGDVHITNPVMDLTGVAGIKVNNVTDGMAPFVGISGGYIAAQGGFAIDIESSRGVFVQNMTLRSPGEAAVKINGPSSRNTIIGNKIDQSIVGVSVVGGSLNSVIGNTINAPPTVPAT